jgi:peptidylprolyl isomerase
MNMKNFLALGLAIGITVVGAYFITGTKSSDAVAIQAEAAKQAADAFASAPSGTSPAAVASAPAVTEATAPAPDQTTPAPVAPSAPTEEKKITAATLHTNKGDISIVFGGDTPNTVANFIKLAKSGFYDGTKFHRVIKNFMIQGGDPLSKDDSHPELWGRGGPGYTFADELGPNNHNVIGTIAMANSGPNTNGSQFFINVNDNSYLDDKHVVFGKVTAGVDVVMAIARTATDSSDRPIDPVIVTSVTVQ